jgi:hypothetical protein
VPERSLAAPPPVVRRVPEAVLPEGYPNQPERRYRKAPRTAKYELDEKRLSSAKPWFAAAVRHWTAELGDSEEARYYTFYG